MQEAQDTWKMNPKNLEEKIKVRNSHSGFVSVEEESVTWGVTETIYVVQADEDNIQSLNLGCSSSQGTRSNSTEDMLKTEAVRH